MSSLSNTTDDSNATTAGVFWECKDQEGDFIFWTWVIFVAVIFGFPGVVVVLFDFFQKGRKGTPFTPYDVFMSNLTVMDGLCLLFTLPEFFIPGPQRNNVMVAALMSSLNSFSLCGRPLFITCICLDCYLAVVHPVTYRARKSLTPRVLMAVGVWTVTAVVGIYFTIRPHEVWSYVSTILLFALTLPVIGFCDFSILWTLKRSKPGGKDIHPQKKKALQIITNNLVLTFISYLTPVMMLLVSWLLAFDDATFHCLVLIPVMGITLTGNTVSLILHVHNLGKLDWLKCWKPK